MKFTDDNYVTQKGHIRYLEELKVLAIKNRKNPTEAEYVMWRYLRKSKYRFLRQKPMFRFILDFYCRELLLCIEIDGDSHDKKKNYDLLRDRYLKTVNIKTIRFTNEEVLNNFDNVLERLLPLLRGDTATPREDLNR